MWGIEPNDINNVNTNASIHVRHTSRLERLGTKRHHRREHKSEKTPDIQLTVLNLFSRVVSLADFPILRALEQNTISCHKKSIFAMRRDVDEFF